MQIGSVGAGTDRPFLAFNRRPDFEHNAFYLTKTGTNIHFGARMFDAGTPANQGVWQVAVGTRTLGTQPYHFQEGDIVRWVFEFEKSNLSVSDANSNLRVIVTAHRIDATSGNIIETIQFDDIEDVPSADPNSAIRGYILGKVGDYNYNKFYFFPADSGSNYLLPMIGLEGFQWITSLSPRDFLHHSELASRSRLPVTDMHRLLGYYLAMLTDRFTLHTPIDLDGTVRMKGDNNSFKAQDGTQMLLTDLLPTSAAGIRQIFSANVNKPSNALIVDTGGRIPSGADATDRFHVTLRNVAGTSVDMGEFTKAQWDAAETIPDRADVGVNHNRALLNRTVGNQIYYIMKGGSNAVELGTSGGGTRTGTYNIAIQQITEGAHTYTGFDTSVARTWTGEQDFTGGIKKGGVDLEVINQDNIFQSVAAILQAGTNITINEDGTKKELEIVSAQRGAPTQAEIYTQLKSILQGGSNITLTEDDADNELTVAAAGGGGGTPAEPVQIHLGVANILGNTSGIISSSGRFLASSGDQAIRFDETTSGTNLPSSITYNNVTGELTLPAGAWILCASGLIRNMAASGAQNSRAYIMIAIRQGANNYRHISAPAYSRWGQGQRPGSVPTAFQTASLPGTISIGSNVSRSSMLGHWGR